MSPAVALWWALGLWAAGALTLIWVCSDAGQAVPESLAQEPGR